jgi:hypothetical protein
LKHGRKLVSVSHNRSSRTLIEETRFDHWGKLAIEHRVTNPLHLVRWLLKIPVDRTADSPRGGGLKVVRSRFGLNTPADMVSGETIRARFTDGLVIAESEFGIRRGYNDAINLTDCLQDSWPEIIGNRFEGGQDDAIDLDSCSSFVVGNLIRGFRPQDLSGTSGNANGGCITGSGPGSTPVAINNVLDGCFHAIGFKDGSQPIIVNNTITNSHIGVTLYQSDEDEPMPSATMINNILWNNISWIDRYSPQDIVLNGKWWPRYNQTDDKQGNLVARHNITASQRRPLEGAGNTTGDPFLQFIGGIPIPDDGSPAIGSGQSPMFFDSVPREAINRFLKTDFLGARRPFDGDEFAGIGRGAVEWPHASAGSSEIGIGGNQTGVFAEENAAASDYGSQPKR